MTMPASWCSLATDLVSACFSVVFYFELHINPNSPVTPPFLIPLGFATFSLPLGTNVIVTTLICARIWYLSPRKARDLRSEHFPTGIGQTVIKIVVESGMLYLVVQLIFVVLMAIEHPAQAIIGVIAVQIYVRIPYPWSREFVGDQLSPKITQGIAPTLILIRVGLGISNMQNGPIRSGPPLSMSQPTSSTQVRINNVSFMEPGLDVPAEMSVSGIKSKPINEDLGSALSSMEKVAAVEV